MEIRTATRVANRVTIKRSKRPLSGVQAALGRVAIGAMGLGARASPFPTSTNYRYLGNSAAQIPLHLFTVDIQLVISPHCKVTLDFAPMFGHHDASLSVGSFHENPEP